MLEIIIIILFALVLVKQVKTMRDLKFPAKKTLVSNLVVILVIIALVYIAIQYANKWTHIAIAILSVLVFLSGYVMSGITSTGFASNSRYNMYSEWNDLRTVILKEKKNDELEIEYSGEKDFGKLYFDMKDYNQILHFLRGKLPNRKIKIVLKDDKGKNTVKEEKPNKTK